MKKITAGLLAIFMLFCLSACEKNAEEQVLSKEEKAMQDALKLISVTGAGEPFKPWLKVKFTGGRPGGYYMKFVVSDEDTGKPLLETVKQMNVLSIPNETAYYIDPAHLLKLHSQRCLEAGSKAFKGAMTVKITLSYEMPALSRGKLAASGSIKAEKTVRLNISYEMKDGKPGLKEAAFDKKSF